MRALSQGTRRHTRCEAAGLAGAVAGALALLGASPRLYAADYWATTVNGIDVVSVGGEADARKLASSLILFERAYFKLNPTRNERPRVPTTIFSLKGSDFDDGFERKSHNVAGFFHANGFANDMVLGPMPRPRASRGDRLQIVYHEYVHYLMRAYSAFRYPAWYEEGFAELFATADVGKDSVLVGKADEDRVWALRQLPLLRAEHMLQLQRSDPGFYSHRIAPAFYSQSWLLVHLISIDGLYKDQATRYLVQMHRGVPEPEAFESSFGVGYEVLDDEIRKTVQGRTRLGALKVRVEPFDEKPSAVRLSQEEFDLRYADAILRHAGGNTKVAEERLRRVLKTRPKDETALRLLARAIARQGRADEARAVLADLESGPISSARTWADIADVIIELTVDDEFDASVATDEQVKRMHAARERYHRALAGDPSDANAIFRLAQTYLRLPDDHEESRQVVPLLRSAFERLPRSEQIVSTLAQLYRGHGERAEGQRFALLWTQLASTSENLRRANRLLLSFDE